MNGVNEFLQFSLDHATNPNVIPCPCLHCGNLHNFSIGKIKEHLFFNGIDRSYKVWFWHGEKIPIRKTPSRKIEVRDDHGVDYEDDLFEMIDDAQYESNVDPVKFQSLLNDAEKPIYPGCTRFTKLSALLRLYNLKAKHRWSDKSFSEMLFLLGELLHEDNEMPSSFYEAKKTLYSLGMPYEKIHACPNDWILYHKKFENEVSCPVCDASRWLKKRNCEEVKDGVLAKLLWYIPPIPHFLHLF